jgi:hypothetical protein
MKALMQNMYALLRAVDSCLELNLTIPALILLYSGIDTIAALEQGRADRNAFTKWVDSYLLASKTLPCSALDLYAARCGVLHTLTSDSDLARSAKAKRILYALGKDDPTKLKAVVDLLKGEPYVVVSVRDLHEGFRLGLAKFIEELETNPTREARVVKSLQRWFTHLPAAHVDGILNASRRTEG